MDIKKDFKWFLGKAILAVQMPGMVWKLVKYNTQRAISDLLSFFGYYKYPHKVIFLAGMAMGGTTWMKNLVAQIPGYYSRSMPMPYEVASNQDICDEALKNIPKYGYAMYKTHLNPTKENLDILERHGVDKVLVTHRDLRDVALSRYYRLLDVPKVKSDPNYLDYVAVGKEAAIDNSIKIICDYNVDWIMGWLELSKKSPEKCMVVKFEDMKKDTKGVFKSVLSFYGIELPEGNLEMIIENAKGKREFKKNWKAASVLPLAIASNFRSGKVGEWRKEFTDRQIEMCKEGLGDVLVELGYEKDLNW